MKTYFSTFITGFSEVIEQALKQKIKDTHILLLSDGLVMYKTSASIDTIKQLRFFNNSFILIKQFPKLGNKPISDMVIQAMKDSRLVPTIASSLPTKKTTFRIMATQENQFVAMDNSLRNRLEHIFQQIRSLRLNRSLPNVEFLFMARREGYGLLGLRFTHHTSYEKTLEKGELYPELAHILCLISEPNAQDVFLDPFCGSGSIPVARAIGFPYKNIFAGDIEVKMVERTRLKAKGVKRRVNVGRWNTLHLSNFAQHAVNKIVTDPPWGLHSGKELNLEKFYGEMLIEIYRILNSDGILVVLIAKKDLFEAVLTQVSGKFKLLKRYDTLVSGQKAGVYKIVPK
jgi:hypothetical protein